MSRERGAAAIIAMMFLMIFGSLAAAMAIVSQGNLAIADSQIKVSRSLAAAETGMNLVARRVQLVASTVTTPHGDIDGDRAEELWMMTDGVRARIYQAFANEFHNVQEPVLTTRGIRIGPIAVGPDAPMFTATIEPHPLPGPNGPTDFSRYDDSFYKRPPYNDPGLFDVPVSSSNPLDARWVRIVVTAQDGPTGKEISRSISMDFRLDKRLRFAILSRNRVMIGSNVVIQGNVGSRFMETHLEHGHPVQLASDFVGLHSDLDDMLDAFKNTLATNDVDGDNRINLSNPIEVAGITNPEQYDTNGDGFIDEFDFFLAHFDANGDGRVSLTELESGSSDPIRAAQLMQLIDTFGGANRFGFGDGFIDDNDRYAKIRGEVMILAPFSSWQFGAANGMYQDYFQGPIHPNYAQPPLTFEATDSDAYEFTPQAFNVQAFRDIAENDLVAQATAQYANHSPGDPTSPNMDLSGSHREEVPFGSANPYDYYDRPVFENMTFQNVTISKGTNALFRNCTFIGVTFVETTTANTHVDFNYAGMQHADGSLKFPDRVAVVNGQQVADTKAVANNIRFDNCTFEGAVVSDAPHAFTHARNKVEFTGDTRFVIEQSQHLSAEEKRLFQRSTLLMPHYSVEMGTFTAPDAGESLELSGTIVAGVVDMRGQIIINGSIITTFEPQSGVEPVIGDTSPHFNTTIGYFASADGDFEMDDMPASGIGMIQIRYDPTLAMPDGITSPIEMRPIVPTYFEGVAP